MRLGTFIPSNLEAILVEWEHFARGTTPGASMDSLALRDHAGDILLATVRDMNSSQSAAQRADKSKGHHTHADGDAALDGASEQHAVGRLGSGFDLIEVVSEYRALRASVLRLWDESAPSPEDLNVEELTRFNESIDQSVNKAVSSYTRRVDQARDLFLGILSHDLRNPLNSIFVSAQGLPLVQDDPAEALAYAGQIKTSASVMGRMISDLLDYTRTRLGTGMPVSPARMDLAALGRELFNEFHSAHRNRDIRFRAEGDLLGDWDTDRVRQAISNIMGNAVQHGAVGEPIELILRSEGAVVLIDVHNGGPPIPAGELPRIFDPLVRGASSGEPKRNRPGSIGLGLYIAREVAKSHGGSIDVTSTAEAGTTFTIRLPRHTDVKTARPVMDEKQFLEM